MEKKIKKLKKCRRIRNVKNVTLAIYGNPRSILRIPKVIKKAPLAAAMIEEASRARAM
jgi:hypothetical protein